MKNNCSNYNTSFTLCVELLKWAAKKLNPIWPGGMDYVKINVLIFCVAGPIIFTASIFLNVLLLAKLL